MSELHLTQSRDNKREAKAGGKLVLACGNTLRGDDGVGWKIAEALETEIASGAPDNSQSEAEIVSEHEVKDQSIQLTTEAKSEQVSGAGTPSRSQSPFDLLVEEVQILITQQLTPDLSLILSEVDTVVLVDCSADLPPGMISISPVEPLSDSAHSLSQGLTHHIDFASLLAMAAELYGATPRRAYALAVGGESFDLSESLSEPVQRSIPEAVAAIKRLLAQPPSNA